MSLFKSISANGIEFLHPINFEDPSFSSKNFKDEIDSIMKICVKENISLEEAYKVYSEQNDIEQISNTWVIVFFEKFPGFRTLKDKGKWTGRILSDGKYLGDFTDKNFLDGFENNNTSKIYVFDKETMKIIKSVNHFPSTFNFLKESNKGTVSKIIYTPFSKFTRGIVKINGKFVSKGTNVPVKVNKFPPPIDSVIHYQYTYEATTIRVYFNHLKEEWIISTLSKQAKFSKYNNEKDFEQLFNEIATIDYNSLNTNRDYFFLMMHPEVSGRVYKNSGIYFSRSNVIDPEKSHDKYIPYGRATGLPSNAPSVPFMPVPIASSEYQLPNFAQISQNPLMFPAYGITGVARFSNNTAYYIEFPIYREAKDARGETDTLEKRYNEIKNTPIEESFNRFFSF